MGVAPAGPSLLLCPVSLSSPVRPAPPRPPLRALGSETRGSWHLPALHGGSWHWVVLAGTKTRTAASSPGSRGSSPSSWSPRCCVSCGTGIDGRSVSPVTVPCPDVRGPASSPGISWRPGYSPGTSRLPPRTPWPLSAPSPWAVAAEGSGPMRFHVESSSRSPWARLLSCCAHRVPRPHGSRGLSHVCRPRSRDAGQGWEDSRGPFRPQESPPLSL